LKCENDNILWKSNILNIEHYLTHSGEYIYNLKWDNINSCDYVMDRENCIRNNILENNVELFYKNIKNWKIDDAVKIAKENPTILKMSFRWVDITNIWEKIYILEIWMDSWFLAFTRIEVEWDKFVAYREWLDLERIYWIKVNDDNFWVIYDNVIRDFNEIK
jgi:hypothetical protein